MNLLSYLTCELKHDNTLIEEIKSRLDILAKRPNNTITQEIVLVIKELLDNSQMSLIWQKNISLAIDCGATLLKNQQAKGAMNAVIEYLEKTLDFIKNDE